MRKPSAILVAGALALASTFAAATKNDPKAPRGTINTPEAEEKLLHQKGQ